MEILSEFGAIETAVLGEVDELVEMAREDAALDSSRLGANDAEIDTTEAQIMARDTYKYHFKHGHKIIHTGITIDLERREQEHKQAYGADGHIMKVGRATTKDAALRWEREQAARGRPTRRR